MNLMENDISALLEYQKKQLAVENFKYYQAILEGYYMPSNQLLKKIKLDLMKFQVELKRDYESDPHFKHVSILKYHDGLSKIVNEFINKGQKLNNDYQYVGKEFNKDSIVVVVSLESLKNLLVEQAFITHNDTGEISKGFKEADEALDRLISQSESIITNIVRSLVTINTELKRDFSGYCIH